MTPGQGQKVTLTDEANGLVIADAVQVTPADAPLPSATWTPAIVTRAKYEVFARWQEANGRATNAPFTIHHEGGSTTVLKNQEQNGNTWMSLGTYVLVPGQNHRVVLGDIANGYVTADVMKFVPVDEATVTWPIASIPANGNYKVYAKWPASPVNASDATYTVTHAGGSTPVTVNQKANGGLWTLLGTFAFDAGAPGYKVELSGDGNGQVAADAIYYANDNAVADSFTWTPTLPSAGDYAVYAKWPTSATDSGTAVYTIAYDGGVASQSVSQRANGGEWVWLGTYAMDPANNPEVMLTGASDGAVYSDAVRFVSGDAIGGDIAYSHFDQIATIQKMTDASGALIWDRIARPFGETVSVNAMSGIEQKLRFPGQYTDETGLSYNYFRDYDPTLGRYLESDPIGLSGGVNTYAYVGGNPIANVDPTGENPIVVELVWLAVEFTVCFAVDLGVQYYQDPCKPWDYWEAAETGIMCMGLIRWVPRWAWRAVAGGRGAKAVAGEVAVGKGVASSGGKTKFKYSRPSGYRKGVRDKVWEKAKGPDGKVRDPVTGREISPNERWDMGHKPGREFRKHQKSAEDRGISRDKFLDEYNDPDNYRPELPSSNRSHAGEDMTDSYFGH